MLYFSVIPNQIMVSRHVDY